MGMMALVALAFTSCKKNEETKRSFIASGQEMRVESLNEDRAYVDGNKKFHFEQGDVCMVFNIDETTPTNSHAALYGAVEEGVTDVHFYNINYGEVAEDMLDGYYAFYPGGPGHTITYLANGENRCKFYVAPEQDYRGNRVPRGHLYAASKASDGSHLMGDTYFMFHPICGILNVLPYESNPTRAITKIEVVDNAWELSGLVELIIPEVNPSELQALFNSYAPTTEWMQRAEAIKTRIGYNVTDEIILDPVFETTTHYVKGNRMTLNFPEGPAQIGTSREDALNNHPFNIVLRPLALCHGFHLILTFDNGDVMDLDYSTMNRPIKPNTISNFYIDLN